MPFHSRSNPNSGPTRRSARPGPKSRRGWIRGVVDEVDPGSRRLKLRVRDGSRVGRRMLGETVLVDAANAELTLPDADGDRGQSLRDVFPGNELQIRFTDDRSDREGLRAVKILHRGPRMPVGGLRRLWS